MICISSIKVVPFAMVFLTFVVFSEQQQGGDQAAFFKKMRENAEGCAKETNVDIELPIKAIREGQFSNDKNLKCFFKCMFQKQGQMDSNGNVDFTSISLDHIPPNVDKAKVTALDKCKNIKETDACETAFLLVKCYIEVRGPIKQ